MDSYQTIAKKYRPHSFADVREQDAIVTTLKNALRFNRIGNAYLLCGPHGTGKTTLARLFAKAINCTGRKDTQEPCNQCQNCLDIQHGASLDVIEIDGASNRGIDDIRQLTETVGYAPAQGKYKIYIIDEVHMLTKEAFNALLKTLEEPPSHVLFLFATTEPHKVLPTIISRCQRFDLKRISPHAIVAKLTAISTDAHLDIHPHALHLIAAHAEGSLRDAESSLDQIACFATPPITASDVEKSLNLISLDLLFELDRAVVSSDLSFAFTLTATLFKSGASMTHFLHALTQHYRHLMLLKVNSQHGPLPHFSESQIAHYTTIASSYSSAQCLAILDLLLQAIETTQQAPFQRIHLEVLLLKIIRSTKAPSIEDLVDRLTQLKARVLAPATSPTALPTSTSSTPPKAVPVVSSQSQTKQEKHLPEEKVDIKKKINHERVIQFAAVELNGHLQRN